MNVATQKCLSSLRLGEPQVHRNIVVFPLLGSSIIGSRWLTLGEAIEQHRLSVSEVSHGGSVPNLIVINRADRPVLLLDGEELIGEDLRGGIVRADRESQQIHPPFLRHDFQIRKSPPRLDRNLILTV